MSYQANDKNTQAKVYMYIYTLVRFVGFEIEGRIVTHRDRKGQGQALKGSAIQSGRSDTYLKGWTAKGVVCNSLYGSHAI